MKVVCEVSLKDFEFFDRAKLTFDSLSSKEIETIEKYFEGLTRDTGEIYTEEQLNNIFRFDLEYIAEILDLSEEEREERGFY